MQVRERDSSPRSIERGVRQLLANKVIDNFIGLWLLVPEHLRLGTWDMVCDWSGKPGSDREPRMAMQLIHEAALCLTGVRGKNALTLKGFSLLNGLPFLAADSAIHVLLNSHTVEQAEQLQIVLGRKRFARNHFQGRVIAIDPHRPRSFSRREMRRHCEEKASKPFRTSQQFFSFDVDAKQPIAFTLSTSGHSVAKAAPALLRVTAAILSQELVEAKQQDKQAPLLVADTEHCVTELADYVEQQTPFDILAPFPRQKKFKERWRQVPPEEFTRHWAGYATSLQRFTFGRRGGEPYWEIVQRTGEQEDDWHFSGFLLTRPHDEVVSLTHDYPHRWYLEEYYNFHQAMGWNRAGTMNLHIRYNRLSMALLAQAALSQLRARLGEPYCRWTAQHLAEELFRRMSGDVRVEEGRIVVTYYNAPPAVRECYENIRGDLRAEQVSTQVPWLYDFELAFRFR